MIAEAYKKWSRLHGGPQTHWHLFPRPGEYMWQSVSPLDREEILTSQQICHERPYPMRYLSDFMAFSETGSREADETPYFFRRKKLCVATLAVCLGDETAMRDVLDGIWCICEESSWVISAHNINPIPGAPSPEEKPLPDVTDPYIDLFAAQTGMILALVTELLSVRLSAVSPLLVSRIQLEIDRRIMRPFSEREDFWWMGNIRRDLCNWTPWIVSNVMLAGCLELDRSDRLDTILSRGAGMLDRWLEVMPADGGSDEGAGYWNMAGGALLDCLEIYETVTEGEISLWRVPKIANILSYPRKAYIGNGWFINFADCDARPFLSGERIQAAGERLEDHALTALGQRMRGHILDEISDVPHFSRVLRKMARPMGTWLPEPEFSDVWLPDLQIRIVRRFGVTLAIKGGNNGENHNHNDVGAFMLYMDNEPVIIDAGNMTYTAKTFSSERYSLWNVRSAYHNVPIIGSCEQLPGREYAAKAVKKLADGMRLRMEDAYGPDSGLVRLERTAVLKPDGTLFLRDEIVQKEPETVTWVFMFREKPKTGVGVITTAHLQMQYPAAFTTDVEEMPVTDSRMRKSLPGMIYRVLITGRKQCELTGEFAIGRCEYHE